MRVVIFTFVLAVAAQEANVAYEGDDDVIVTTTNGPIQGRADSTTGIQWFFGVPIGQDSVGANRWKPPQSITWTDTRVTVVEKMCPQQNPMTGVLLGDEDCLAVDIMTYASVDPDSPAPALPIMVWIHGGGFMLQDPHFAKLTGAQWPRVDYSGRAGSGKVVSALTHYRLGALGWMAHPGFTNNDTFMGGKLVGSGNYGMMDTMTAIKFMYDNAATFYGDANKITVIGESAGAAHTLMLLASPLLEGYVSGFIAESPFISFSAATYSLAARIEMGQLFTHRAGCTTITVGGPEEAVWESEATCLRDADMTNLITDVYFSDAGFSGASRMAFDLAYAAALEGLYADNLGTLGAEFYMDAALFTYNTIQCWPVVDGFLLEMPPLAAYSVGTNDQANVIIGHNADEYTTFCYGGSGWICYPGADPFNTGADPFNMGWILGLYYVPADASFSKILKAVLAATYESPSSSKWNLLTGSEFLYDVVAGTPVNATDGSGVLPAYQSKFIQMGTDAWFTTGNEQAINALLASPGREAAGTSVYHFVFADETDAWAVAMGACHGCELTYIWGWFKEDYTYLSYAYGDTKTLMGNPFTEAQMELGETMMMYWSSFFWTGSPNYEGDGLDEWVPMTLNDKQTMHFQANGAYKNGAKMNPCVRYAACRTESGKDFRSAIKYFWSTSPSTPVKDTSDKCTEAPTGVYTHSGAQAELTCSYLPCCTYARRSRSLLFGMPSKPEETECDPMC